MRFRSTNNKIVETERTAVLMSGHTGSAHELGDIESGGATGGMRGRLPTSSSMVSTTGMLFACLVVC